MFGPVGRRASLERLEASSSRDCRSRSSCYPPCSYSTVPERCQKPEVPALQDFPSPTYTHHSVQFAPEDSDGMDLHDDASGVLQRHSVPALHRETRKCFHVRNQDPSSVMRRCWCIGFEGYRENSPNRQVESTLRIFAQVDGWLSKRMPSGMRYHRYSG